MSCQTGFYAKGRGGQTNYIVWSTAFIAISYTEKARTAWHQGTSPRPWRSQARYLQYFVRGGGNKILGVAERGRPDVAKANAFA
eukprot:1268378-Heterocapsa_arctica.AAC.1